MRIGRALVPIALTAALAGCAEPSTVLAPVAASTPSPMPTAAAIEPTADILPPEDPDARYPIEITVPLDHVVSIDEAQSLAAAWGLTPANFSYANGCVAGQIGAGRIDSAVARLRENFGTEPQIVSFSVDYRVVDVFDFASYPRVTAQPTGRVDDFAAATADCS